MKTLKHALVFQIASWLWLAAQAQTAPVLVNYQSRLANRDGSERTRAKPQRGGLFIGSVCPAMYFLFLSGAAAGLLRLIGWMADWLVAHGEKPNTAPLKNKKGMLGWGGVSINRSPRWGLGAMVILLAGVRLVGQAQIVPPLVNYQGRLSNPDGSPLPTADYQLTFSIYDAATNGALVWGPQIFDGPAALGHGPKIPVVQGYFNVMLGPTDTNGVSLANAFNATNRFVEITVSNHNPILPRQQILTAPFAFQAANAAKLAGYDWGAVFNTNDPSTGKILGSKLANGTVTAQQIASNTITANQIANATITAQQLASGASLASNQVWLAGGNAGTTPGANFLGTTDNQALEVKVNGQRALRLEPNIGSPILIGGYSGNNAALAAGAVIGGGGYSGNVNQIGTNGSYAVISGGASNSVSGSGGAIGGGSQNNVSGGASTIAGGAINSVSSTFSVIAGGYRNTISNNYYSFIGGGQGNFSSGLISTIAGGQGNAAGGDVATVVGGDSNTNLANYGFIGGGLRNYSSANYNYATIAGGYSNTVNSSYSSIGGGERNLASGGDSVISGGERNVASGSDSAIGGGSLNLVGADRATVGGGESNTNLASYGVIGGGNINFADSGYASVIGGGASNYTAGTYPVVGGGIFNRAQYYGTVPGGVSNDAVAYYSFAAGQRAKSHHQGTFVWADSTDADFTSAGNNQFLIRAGGNVGINKNNPGTALDVNGTITATNFSGSGSGLTALNGTNLLNNSVGAQQIAPSSITAAQIANGTITAQQIGSNQVWLAGGNAATTPGANFVGTTDNKALELRVNGQRALRLEPITGSAPNVIAGYLGNSIQNAGGATISGGGDTNAANQMVSNSSYSFIGGGYSNTIASRWSVLAGGQNNTIGTNDYSALGGGQLNAATGDHSTVAGGLDNVASGSRSAVAGGYLNVAAGSYAAAPGGRENSAAADYCFAAGRRAKANNQGAFVWADSSDADFASTANDQYLIRAGGNVGINKNNPGTALDVNGAVTASAFIGSGAGLTGLALTNLAPRQSGASAGVGGIAMSSAVTTQITSAASSPGNPVSGLSVSLSVAGNRPVMVLLTSASTDPNNGSAIDFEKSGTAVQGGVIFLRNGSVVSSHQFLLEGANGALALRVPPGACQFIDIPISPGTYTYSVNLFNYGSASTMGVNYVQLVAFEF
jgi:hypothetical protein